MDGKKPTGVAVLDSRLVERVIADEPVRHRAHSVPGRRARPEPIDVPAGNGPADESTRLSRTDYVRTALGLATSLILVLAAVKLVLLPFPVHTVGELVRWLLRWAIVASADVCFAAGLCLAVLGSGRVASRSRWLLVGWRVGAYAVFGLAGMYAVVSVPLFKMTMVPLTLQVLSFSGGPGLLASSVEGFATPVSLTGLALAPLVVGGGPWVVARLPFTWRTRLAQPPILAALVGLVAAYGGISHLYIQARWTDPNRWERRISFSPHAVFVGSCARALYRGDALGLDFDPESVDESDFMASGVQPQPALVLPLESPNPRNLIVIVLESVGVDYLGLYGSPFDTTPKLARRAAEGGIVFDNVYAHAPSSPKGLVALTASVYPGIDWRLITRDSPQFSVPTLAQTLKAKGYRTAYLHSGYWSWKNRDRFLSARGVDRLIDADSLHVPMVNSWGVSDRELFQAGLEYIDEAPDQPFHLLLWTIETHHPYVAEGRQADFGQEDEELERYLNALRNADALIDWLMIELARRGLAEDTIVAVTGDHGESFGKHGQRVHSFGIFEENVHVPWIVLGNGLGERGSRRPEVCQQIDVAPTLLGLLGIAAPEAWQGCDLLRSGDAASNRRAYFYSTGNEVLLGLRDGRLKYHYHLSTGYEELFDLLADPAERENIAEHHQALCQDYRRRVGGLVTWQRRFLARNGAE
jgi:phosphoglycerol transferase MdoB-like AlkP superfamily enzyme